MADKQLVLGFFPDEAAADTAADALKDSGITDADKARITVELNAGKAAVAVMAHDDTAPAISDKLTQLGGSSESHELTDEALETAAATTSAA